MQLGAFSISLGVKDLAASQAFYEKLGFSPMGGDPAQKYLIMKNDHILVGLFEGMFEGAMLTFNPGWDQDAQNLESFEDIRDIKARLSAQGLALAHEQGGDTGPASVMLTDPDGFAILIDQHR